MKVDGLIITPAKLFSLRGIIDEQGFLRLSEMLAQQGEDSIHYFTDNLVNPSVNSKGYHKTSYTHRG